MKKELFDLDLTVNSINGAIEPDAYGFTVKCSYAPGKDEVIDPEVIVC